MQLSPVVAGLMRLGQWQLGTTGLVGWIQAAIDLGITSFDHADIYGNYTVEALFGEALAAAPGLRQRLQIVTKCGIRRACAQRPEHRIHSYDSSRAHVQASVDNSLRALRTDHIDCLLLHRPDLLAEPEELAHTFSSLRAAGKVLHFGVSNHSTQQVMQLHRRFALATHQLEFSPLQMKALADGTLDQCTDLSLRPMLWSPLAGGRLFNESSEQAIRVRAVLGALAAEHGVSSATVAYAWLLRHPSRPWLVTGSGRNQALREATAALTLRLQPEEWYRVWVASMGHGVA
jgi:predicted oxidoreductase